MNSSNQGVYFVLDMERKALDDLWLRTQQAWNEYLSFLDDSLKQLCSTSISYKDNPILGTPGTKKSVRAAKSTLAANLRKPGRLISKKRTTIIKASSLDDTLTEKQKHKEIKSELSLSTNENEAKDDIEENEHSNRSTLTQQEAPIKECVVILEKLNMNDDDCIIAKNDSETDWLTDDESAGKSQENKPNILSSKENKICEKILAQNEERKKKRKRRLPSLTPQIPNKGSRITRAQSRAGYASPMTAIKVKNGAELRTKLNIPLFTPRNARQIVAPASSVSSLASTNSHNKNFHVSGKLQKTVPRTATPQLKMLTQSALKKAKEEERRKLQLQQQLEERDIKAQLQREAQLKQKILEKKAKNDEKMKKIEKVKEARERELEAKRKKEQEKQQELERRQKEKEEARRLEQLRIQEMSKKKQQEFEMRKKHEEEERLARLQQQQEIMKRKEEEKERHRLESERIHNMIHKHNMALSKVKDKPAYLIHNARFVGRIGDDDEDENDDKTEDEDEDQQDDENEDDENESENENVVTDERKSNGEEKMEFKNDSVIEDENEIVHCHPTNTTYAKDKPDAIEQSEKSSKVSNYEMTILNPDDSIGDEYDSSKPLPSWCNREQFQAALHKQYNRPCKEREALVKRIFHPIDLALDMVEIFKGSNPVNPKYARRGSSAVWDTSPSFNKSSFSISRSIRSDP